MTDKKSELIKISENELSEIIELRSMKFQLTSKLGELYLEKKAVDEQIIIRQQTEDDILSKIIDVNIQEQSVAQRFNAKYGKGTLNTDTGTFEPAIK